MAQNKNITIKPYRIPWLKLVVLGGGAALTAVVILFIPLLTGLWNFGAGLLVAWLWPLLSLGLYMVLARGVVYKKLVRWGLDRPGMTTLFSAGLFV